MTIKPELDSIFDEINITSIEDGLMIRQPEGEAQSLKINLAAKGGSGGLLWFVNGKSLNNQPTRSVLSYEFKKGGQYRISTIDQTGFSDALTICCKNVVKML